MWHSARVEGVCRAGYTRGVDSSVMMLTFRSSSAEEIPDLAACACVPLCGETLAAHSGPARFAKGASPCVVVAPVRPSAHRITGGRTRNKAWFDALPDTSFAGYLAATATHLVLSPWTGKATRRGSGVPIYEYRCRECGGRFERLVSMSAADLPQACKQCGAEAAERLFSSFAVRVSGRASASSSGKSCSSCSRSSCASC
jgi:putative FmdB family regulatory protein